MRHVMTFKDFYNKQHSILIEINYFKKDKTYENMPEIYSRLPAAYQLVATCFDGNIENLVSAGKTPANGETLIDAFRKARSDKIIGSGKTVLCSFSEFRHFNKLSADHRVQIYFYQGTMKIDCNFEVKQTEF